MELKILDSTSSSEVFEKVITIYRHSFPECERRTESSLFSLVKQTNSPYKLMAVISDGGDVVGLVSTWNLTDVVYVEHLAMDPACRGNGIGGSVVDAIVAMAGDVPVVVEVEPAETSTEAVRRIGFYQRHGFSPLFDFEYIQPPYSPELPSVRLMLMSTVPINATKVARELHRKVYGVGV